MCKNDKELLKDRSEMRDAAVRTGERERAGVMGGGGFACKPSTVEVYLRAKLLKASVRVSHE